MRILGLDGGIASIGWALIEIDETGAGGDGQNKIVAAGTWMFDAPEEKSQTGTKLKSELRRTFRGQRRVIRRRRQRMNEVRRILARHGLLLTADKDALKHPGLDPWRLRDEGLDRVLTPTEFAVALGHIARHRGFKSNAKGTKSTDAPDETSKMKKAVAGTQERLARFETPARMLNDDESFIIPGTTVRRFRNRDGDYSRSLLRDDLASEVRALFRAQRRLQAGHSTKELEDEFMDETHENSAFFQRRLQDSERMVGSCPFEPDQKRSPKRGYSFERFRCLSRLRNLTLRDGSEEYGLSVEQIRNAMADFGATAKFTFAALRKKLPLPDAILFVGVKPDEEKKLDVVARSGDAAAGTAKLRRVIIDGLGELTWGSLVSSPERLDKIAEIISFRNDLDSIRRGLTEARFDEALVTMLVQAASDGALDVFTGVGHISAKAARNIIPGLLQGLTYDKACAQAGYDHTASRERHAFDVGVTGKEALARILSEERISRELVGSPTARKALIEAVKQVKAVVEKYDVPDRIYVELARDVGKSIEERREIERGIEKRNKHKDKLRELFEKEIGRPPQEGSRGAEQMLRFELWQEQQGRCLYSDTYISPSQLAASDNSVQIDHILPWGRFADDSFVNKTLCTAKANQEKKGRTPFEWFLDDKTPAEWDAFVARIESIQYMKGFKKRNYKLKNAEEAAEKFRNRNLNDTRWTCRLLAEALKQMYPANEKNAKGEGIRRVFTRPGQLTDKLRRAWGLQALKKNEKGERIPDDRHHALDAIVVAATTEGMLQRVTKQIQKLEAIGSPYDLKNIPKPWEDFPKDAKQAFEKVFVARAERRRARGKAHDATIRHIAARDGEQKVYERKKVGDLKASDLERVKDADRNAALIESLRAWVEEGKPADAPPLSPKGDPISKVRLVTKGKVNISIDTGNPDRLATVDRGEMARVDVFRKGTKRGKYEYFLVPIYPHEIATMDTPPKRAVTAFKPESEWPEMDQSFEFLRSLYPMTLVRIINSNGEVYFPDQPDGNIGYFRGLHRGTGNINISSVSNSNIEKEGIGPRRLQVFDRLALNRLGLVTDEQGCLIVTSCELRTWRGKVCT
ncbi:MAG: type II CRISPR RNA-guided endonuclease Cas9 [Beijerinckiaceae bacterium]